MYLPLHLPCKSVTTTFSCLPSIIAIWLLLLAAILRTFRKTWPLESLGSTSLTRVPEKVKTDLQGFMIHEYSQNRDI